jgi:hypothetical protein
LLPVPSFLSERKNTKKEIYHISTFHRDPYSSAHAESLLSLSSLKARSKRIFSRQTGSKIIIKHIFRIMQLLAAVDGDFILKATQRILRTDSTAPSWTEGRKFIGAIYSV